MDYFRIRQTNLAEVISGREKRVGPFPVDRYFAETNTIDVFFHENAFYDKKVKSGIHSNQLVLCKRKIMA